MIFVLKKYKMSKGLTMIELMVSLTVFAILLIAFMGLFASAINQYRRIMQKNMLLSAASYAAEYMDRAIRMARKDLTGDCLGAGAAKDNFSNPLGLASLRFLNSDNKCTEFYLEGGQIKVKKSNNNQSSGFPASGESITASNITVESLRFFIVGDGQANVLQPRVTIAFYLKDNNPDFQRMYLQTTVSQRELDVTY